MKRYLRALGLGLLAAFAMSAVAASGAQAETPGKFTTAEYPSVITAEQEGAENFLEATPGNRVTCSVAHYEATLTEASSTITVTPHYEGCKSEGLEIVVDLNGCHFVFHAGTYIAATDTSHGSADIVCPAEKQIERTIGPGICTIDLPAQTGLSTVTYTNKSSTEVTIDVNITNLTYTDTDVRPLLCPFAGNSTHNDGKFVSEVIAHAYKDIENIADPLTAGQLDYKHGATQIGLHVR